MLTNTTTLIVTVTAKTTRPQPQPQRQLAGGPKLRKWYGQGERPADGGGLRHGADAPGPGEDLDANVPRDAVLVTDADTPMGEFVVLQLILARCGAACSRQCRWQKCSGTSKSLLSSTQRSGLSHRADTMRI